MSQAAPEQDAFTAAAMKALLRPLSALKDEDGAWAGGKAAGLAKALAGGVPVPPGVVLGPAALDAMLDHAQLRARYASALEEARQERFEAMDEVMRELVGASFPAPLHDALVEAVSSLPIGPLAVRSSASAEDRVESAGAGAFGSELGVGRPDVDAAIRRVWARSHSAAAFQAMLAAGLDPAGLKLAVLIQAEVPADFAGVLFTVDPLDPAHRHMRAALRAGHASGVVEGEAAEEAQISRVPVLERRLAPLTPWQQALAKLRPLGLQLEAIFGRPLDVEAAWLGGRWTLLQVRPIAQLGPADLRGPAPRWSRSLAEERFPEPMTPFGWSALQSGLRVNLASLEQDLGFQPRPPEAMVRSVGGVIYANPDFFKVPESLKPSYGRLWQELRPMWGALVRLGLPAWWRHRQASAEAPPLGRRADDPRFRLAMAAFEGLVFPRARRIEEAWAKDFPEHQAAFAALSAIDPKGMGRQELLDHAKALQAASDAFMGPDFAIYALKQALAWMVGQVATVVHGGPDSEALVRLTGGLEGNATLEMNAALDQLARGVAGDPFLHDVLGLGDRAAIAQAWSISAVAPMREAFLVAYGHVSPSWDLAKPTLGERPERLDAWLQARLKGGLEGGARQHATLAACREAEWETWRGRLAFDPKLVAFAEALLGHLHAMVRLDECHHMHAGRLFPAVRRLMAVMGRRLAEAGAISEPMDVVFLTLEEALAALEEVLPFSRRRLVARRQQSYDSACGRQAHPPELWGDFPVEPPEAVPSDPDLLTGQPGSPGVAEGPVRVVRDLMDLADLQPGEVLVSTSPKPSFTPAFAYACAIVTDRGSALSHGLITAREYGLPAVTATLDATRRLHTGERVRVDGSTGRVVRLRQAKVEEAPAPSPPGATPPPAPKAPRPTPWSSPSRPHQAFPSLGPVRPVGPVKAPEAPLAPEARIEELDAQASSWHALQQAAQATGAAALPLGAEGAETPVMEVDLAPASPPTEAPPASGPASPGAPDASLGEAAEAALGEGGAPQAPPPAKAKAPRVRKGRGK